MNSGLRISEEDDSMLKAHSQAQSVPLTPLFLLKPKALEGLPVQSFLSGCPWFSLALLAPLYLKSPTRFLFQIFWA